MLVVLDDSQDRINEFKTAFSSCLCFKDPNEFIAFVKDNLDKITCMSLDHDLEWFEFNMYGKKEITGLDVVKNLVDIIPDKSMRIIIHSWNPDGAKRMKNHFIDHNFTDIKVWSFPWWF